MKRRKQLSELIYRVRHGRWCDHTVGGGFSSLMPWRIVDGMRKHRWCTECGRSEFV